MLVTLFLIFLLCSTIATIYVLSCTYSPDEYQGLALAIGPLSLAGILLTLWAGQHTDYSTPLLLLVAIFFPPFAASAYALLDCYVLEPLEFWNARRLEEKYGKAPLRTAFTPVEADLPTMTGDLDQVVAELQRNLDEMEKLSDTNSKRQPNR